jgi:hypothetical protein
MFERYYSSYQDYLTHQAEKTNNPELPKRHQLNWDRTVIAFRKTFEILKPILPHDAVGLCLGARCGEEVAALRSLGYQNTYGIDIVPHPPLVRQGDMNRVECRDHSYDFLFSNAIDHAYDIETFLGEVNRIARPTATVLFHVALNHFGNYESIVVESADELINMMPGWSLADQRRINIRPYHLGLLFRRDSDE